MSDCKIYPADTVDIYGNVWSTVGENIRNGIFGENVKGGSVNINNGSITSTDFNITQASNSVFIINKINCIFCFPESIEKGALDISFINSTANSVIRNGTDFSAVVATLKIIYKDII